MILECTCLKDPTILNNVHAMKCNMNLHACRTFKVIDYIDKKYTKNLFLINIVFLMNKQK